MPLLEARAVVKSFGANRVLQGVDFTLRAGQIHALLGQNGAGKSTLIKILSGVQPLDSGEVLLQGSPVRFSNPLEARRGGIATVHQELSLVPQLSVAENLLLGRWSRKYGTVSWKSIMSKARAALDRLGLHVDLKQPVGTLPISQQQLIEIARTLTFDAKVLILDEPTAALGQKESERLFSILEALKNQGMGIIYISHRLDEIEQIASEATVLRDGHVVYTGSLANVSRDAIVQHMVGHRIANTVRAKRERTRDDKPVLRIKDASGRNEYGAFAFRGVDLTVHRGELLGITGPVGSGAIELARTVFGISPLASGEMELMGQPYNPRTAQDAIRRGVAFVSDDRRRDGLIGDAPIRSNISATVIGSLTRWGLFQYHRESELADPYITELHIQPQDPHYSAGLLSGGNQQRVVLAKWLLRDAHLVVLCEPTRGVDIEAKAQVYRIIDQLCASGKAVLMISSDFQEVAMMSDRVLVMGKGEPVAELVGDDVTEAAVLRAVFQVGDEVGEVQSRAN